jgi:metal-responsive CopG/Arc/MetJ family transcriptional regulator
MDSGILDPNRKTCQMGIRPFVDQIDSLRHLRVYKHRSRRSISDLIREALDQYIDRENEQLAGRRG